MSYRKIPFVYKSIDFTETFQVVEDHLVFERVFYKETSFDRLLFLSNLEYIKTKKVSEYGTSYNKYTIRIKSVEEYYRFINVFTVYMQSSNSIVKIQKETENTIKEFFKKQDALDSTR